MLENLLILQKEAIMYLWSVLETFKETITAKIRDFALSEKRREKNKWLR